TEEMFSRQNKDFYWTAADGGVSGVTKDASGNDNTIGPTIGVTVELTSAAVFGSYPAGALDDAVATIQVMPGNSSAKAPVTSHSGSTIIFDYTGASTVGYGYGDGVALINVAQDISAGGQWAYKTEGDGSFTLYFWPYNASKMDEIRLTSRNTVMNFGRAEYWTFYGIDGTAPGGTAARDGQVFWSNEYAATYRYGLRFEECKASQFGSGGTGFGIDMSRTPECQVLNCTVDYGFGGRGAALSFSSDSWMDQCLIKRQSFTGMRLSAGERTVFSYSEISDIRSVHGNGMSIYQGAEDIVVWGNIIDMTGGDIGMTNQESANLWIGMNLVICSEAELQNRGIEN
ncbi:right-handed parallel beta-helix repeat-containing protein, partial [Sedimentitalea sp. JM2-8]